MIMSREILNNRLTEIENIQKQVENIIYSKNWFVRTFMFNKAMRLHKLADDKIQTLYADFAKSTFI